MKEEDTNKRTSNIAKISRNKLTATVRKKQETHISLPALTRLERTASGVHKAIGRHRKAVIATSVILGTTLASAMLAMHHFSNVALTNGSLLVDKQEYQQAIKELNFALLLNTTNSQAYKQRAFAESKLDQTRRALKDYESVLWYEPNEEDALAACAQFYVKANRFDDAVRMYNRLMIIDSDDMDALHKRANACTLARKYNQAIADYLRLLQIQPYLYKDDPRAVRNLLLACQETGQQRLCLALLNRSLVMFPNNLEALIARAQIENSLKQYEKSLSDYSQALRIAPANLRALIGRAKAKQCSLNYEDDLRDIETALKLDKDNADAYLVRALHWSSKQKPELAKADFAKSLEKNYVNLEAHRAQVDFLIQQQDFATALRKCNELELLPDFIPTASFYRTKAKLAEKTGNVELVQKSLEKSLNLETSNKVKARIWIAQALTQSQKKNYRDAVEMAQRAISLDPTNSDAIVQHGIYSLKLGNKLTAMSDYDTAIKLDKSNFEAYMQRGEVFLEGERYQSAAKDFQQALKIKPSKLAESKLKESTRGANRLATITVKLARQGLTRNELLEMSKMTAPQLIARARESMNAGDNVYGLTALMRAVQLEPNNVPARQSLFQAYVANNQADEAAQQMKFIFCTGKQSLDQEIEMANLFASVATPAGAKRTYQMLIDQNKKSADPNVIERVALLNEKLKDQTAASNQESKMKLTEFKSGEGESAR